MEKLQTNEIHNLLTFIIYNGDHNTPINEIGFDQDQQKSITDKLINDERLIDVFIKKSLDALNYITDNDQSYDMYTLTFQKSQINAFKENISALEKLKWLLCYNVATFNQIFKSAKLNPSTNIRVFRVPIKLNTELYNMYCKLSSDKDSEEYKNFISYFSTGQGLPFEIAMLLMGGNR